MLITGWLQLGVIFLLLVLLSRPLGAYLVRAMNPRERLFLDPILKPVEKFIYRVGRIDPLIEQNWKSYLISLLTFSLFSAILTSLILACQYYLPLNPQRWAAPSWDLNVNTSVSFMTNTNWQSYGGETTMSYFSQMAALAVQNFTSAATGLAVAVALVRGICRRSAMTVGNFWTDLVRGCLYVFLPISIFAAAIFLAEGVPQNFNSYAQVKTLEGDIQTIAQGPIASQEAIKLLGTNGGGFMMANSSHPYENPTPLTNLLQVLLVLLLPAAQIYYFGECVENRKHAWCIFIALAIVFFAGATACIFCEASGNPEWGYLGLTDGNWEGKEQRFGLCDSAIYACATTATSCGAVNCMHDSLTPMGGLIPMLNMQLSQVIFGGVGSGLISVLLMIFLAIFISGLIIGRTPEYLGKKIDIFDIRMTMLAILPYVWIVHAFTSWACFSGWGIAGIGNSGPHGFSEILYAYSSAAANNGSSFGGLSSNSPAYNLTLAAAMLLGRFLVIIPVIGLAGSMTEKKMHPETAASFPVSSLIFTTLLIGIVFLLGALTFFPALTLGPLLEEFFMRNRVLFP
jgi:K+-transporting ATPase ATPase A chain